MTARVFRAISEHGAAAWLAAISLRVLFVATMVALVSLASVLPWAVGMFALHFLKSPMTRLVVEVGAFLAEVVTLVYVVDAVSRAFVPRRSGVPCEATDLLGLRVLVSDVHRDLAVAGHRPIRFDRIDLDDELNASTFAARGDARITLGWPLVVALDPTELRCVVAHEHMHHANSAMLFHAAVADIRVSLLRLVDALTRAQDRSTLLNRVANGFRSVYVAQMLMLGSHVVLAAGVLLLDRWLRALGGETSHLFEFHCDAGAAACYGREPMAAALYKLGVAGKLWALYRAGEPGKPDPLRFRRFLAANLHDAAADFLAGDEPDREGETHPSCRARGRALGLEPAGFEARVFAGWRAALMARDPRFETVHGHAVLRRSLRVRRALLVAEGEAALVRLFAGLRLDEPATAPSTRHVMLWQIAYVLDASLVADADHQGALGWLRTTAEVSATDPLKALHRLVRAGQQVLAAQSAETNRRAPMLPALSAAGYELVAATLSSELLEAHPTLFDHPVDPKYRHLFGRWLHTASRLQAGAHEA